MKKGKADKYKNCTKESKIKIVGIE